MNVLNIIYAKIAIMVFFLAAACVFFFTYFEEDMEKAVYEFNIQKNSFDVFLDRGEYLKSLTKDYLYAVNGADVLRGSFVKKSEMVDFIKEMENIFERTNNAGKIVIISSDGDIDAKAFMFQAQLFGDFSGLMNFLAEAENGKYQISVKRLVVNKLQSSGSIGNILKANQAVYGEGVNLENMPVIIHSILDMETYIID